MSRKIGRIVNLLLKPAKIRIERRRPETQQKRKAPWYKYINAIQEFKDCLTAQMLGELPHFENRIELIADLHGVNISEAFWIISSLHQSFVVEGDVCEFGAAAGKNSALLANEIRNTDKSLWLFDSFQGLPEPSKKDELLDDFWGLQSIEAYESTMIFSANSVKSRLKAISFPSSRVTIVSGFIEETIRSHNLPDSVCFAFVDFDFYKPILVALNCLSHHLAPRGHIIVDDYCFFSSGVKTAGDEFMTSHSEHFTLELPLYYAGHFAILSKNS